MGIKDWHPKKWYNGEYNCKPYSGVRYEEDIPFWCNASPVALFDHIKYFDIKVDIQEWRKICEAVKRSEHGN